MGMIKAVVFDLDGTLVDSADDIVAALNHGLAQSGRAPMAVASAHAIISVGLERMVELALLDSGGLPGNAELERLQAVSRDYYDRNLLVHTQPYLGAIESLLELRTAGIRLGVCTNKLLQPACRVLAELAMEEYFDVVIGRDSQEHAKPHPAPLLAALNALDADPARAIMVGDSGIDVACARAAGVPVIVMRHGYSEAPADSLGADLVLDDFHGLSQALLDLGTRPS
jgi:phosphoglycolate phosphatase